MINYFEKKSNEKIQSYNKNNDKIKCLTVPRRVFRWLRKGIKLTEQPEGNYSSL